MMNSMNSKYSNVGELILAIREPMVFSMEDKSME
jgi:hypothetical protein